MSEKDEFKSSVYIRSANVGNETVIELRGQEPMDDLLRQAKELMNEMRDGKNNNGGDER